MTGKTHRAGGALSCVVGYIVLRDKGLTMQDTNEYLQLLSMYPWSIWGSTGSDQDHNRTSIPSKDFFSLLLYRLLHLTVGSYTRYSGILNDENANPATKRAIRRSRRYKISRFFCARHRSWQTHSDLTIAVILLSMPVFSHFIVASQIELLLLNIIYMGISLGLLSHIILDSLTTDGIHLLFARLINATLLRNSRFKLPEKLHLVPRSKLFSCDGSWENFIRRLLNIMTGFSFIYLVVLIEQPKWFLDLLDKGIKLIGGLIL